MEQQKQDARARWRGLLTEQQESGQSIAGFCRNRALPIWQFYEWKKRLHADENASFVAVEVVASKPVETVPPPIAPMEIRLRHGRSVLVGPDFEAPALRRLLHVLEQDA